MSADAPLRTDMEERRRELAQRVLAAFDGVTRRGGVSRSQSWILEDAIILSNAQLGVQLAAAEQRDRELDWIDLARTAEWRDERDGPDWNFIDPIGARYYLGVVLLMDLERGVCAIGMRALARGPREKIWSLLSEEQRRVVGAYLVWKRDVAGVARHHSQWREMSAALEAGWNECTG